MSDWGYNSSHLIRFIEEAIAETYGTGSLNQGVALAMGSYGVTALRLLIESAAYFPAIDAVADAANSAVYGP